MEHLGLKYEYNDVSSNLLLNYCVLTPCNFNLSISTNNFLTYNFLMKEKGIVKKI